jgi:hypothetical protein
VLRHPEPLAGGLDAERAALLEGVRQAAQLRHDVGGVVDAFDVSRVLGDAQILGMLPNYENMFQFCQ